MLEIHNNNDIVVTNRLPWIIESKIIYILCNYRHDRYKAFKIKDVYNIAGVSKAWRYATRRSLNDIVSWCIQINMIKLEEYREHYENDLCLLSAGEGDGHHNKVKLMIDDASSKVTAINKQYVDSHLQWFTESIIKKTTTLYFGRSELSNWVSHFSRVGGPIPTLTTMFIYNVAVPLYLFNHLKELHITFYKRTSQYICSVLENCHSLESLSMDIGDCPNLDMDMIFSSIPRSTLTKLCWGEQYQYQPPYDSAVQSYPFHLLPKTIRELIVWDPTQMCSQSYYDFVQANSVHTVAQYSLSTLECIHFLSSPSSPIKDLYLDVCDSPPFSIKEKALIPPMLESLELNISSETCDDVLDCIFNHSGSLPTLFTIKLDTACIIQLTRFIQKSKSLKTIHLHYEFSNQSINGPCDSWELFLDAIANSPSIELVYLGFKDTEIINIINTYLKTNQNSNQLEFKQQQSIIINTRNVKP
ncbi:hypothetical protein DFA_07952 [Cavenderia fasciculata]|uniref:F-box domain-containing protein n=1 Tax=Cavenderia fasciculata TaxID=261658 RepID=F4Q4A9_CACFS|nr:uncharacterized protein DFA_07952 [Cavenderia fasciculata]EGG16971.1 hypothetical protein DFA_07952 [Cavenderia fasciculata]|eukprot:XP_004355448.1 hypothetical protein DFA_07952 [Cavenderia fasciculata]